MKYLIDVTNDDIDAAREVIPRGTVSACNCPIARALTRASGYHVTVSQVYLSVYHAVDDQPYGDPVWKARTPDSLMEFMDQFDTGHPVEPICVEVEFA